MEYLTLLINPGFIIEFVVIAYIVYKQVHSYKENKSRMDQYMDIFSHSDTWDVEISNVVFKQVSRITRITGGASNIFFKEIQDTINKYISGNSNSVMDFQIIKDTVDRQCDSIENQIESQTPVPLYLGLAGSMVGIIVGLITLVLTGDFTKLVDGNQGSFYGIASLLLAVAVAMVASLCGIGMTTKITYEYKDKKSEAESGKSAFISWMQSVVFPSLPNDIPSATTQLVRNLDNFNTIFKDNTSCLSNTFDKVNEAYKNQADIVKAVKDMDVLKMATANARILMHLETCTEKLERFNEYLDRIEGYTSTIQKFNEQFNAEETQLGLLREIRDFFKAEFGEVEQRKKAIGNAVSSVDLELQHAFKDLGDSCSEQSEHFKSQLDEQNKQYKGILDGQQKVFIDAYKEIQQKLEDKLKEIPESLDKLKDIAEIPGELKTLSNNIQHSMEQLFSNFDKTLSKINPETTTQYVTQPPIVVKPTLSKLEKVIGISLLGIMTLSSIGAVVFCALTYLGKQ